MSRVVVLACDANEDYAFFAPITCAIWRDFGFAPLLLLVGDGFAWVKAQAEAVGARCLAIGSAGRHETSTFAQVCRLFGYLACDREDWVITSDVDMWPLTSRFFVPRDEARFNLWYANVFAGQLYPVCYLGAPAPLWGHVMAGTGTVGDATRRALDDGLGADEEATAVWNFDERLFTSRLHAVPGWRGLTVEIHRGGAPPRDRIDRSRWPCFITLRGKVDCHVLRPGDGENWRRLRRVVRALERSGRVMRGTLRWADAYHRAWQQRAHPD